MTPGALAHSLGSGGQDIRGQAWRFWACLGQLLISLCQGHAGTASHMDTPTIFGRHPVHWYIPTLLRNRAYQLHPWTRQARSRRGARADRRGPSWPTRGIRQRSRSTDLLPCIAALTAMDVLITIRVLWRNLSAGRACTSILHQASWPMPYSLPWTRQALSIFSQLQVGRPAGHVVHELNVAEVSRDQTKTTARRANIHT